MSSASSTPPSPTEDDMDMPRRKNAASQFRSMRKRISHPLLDSREDAIAPSTTTTTTTNTTTTMPTPYAPSVGANRSSYDTPPRTTAATNAAVTPDSNRSPGSAALVDALRMAARPSSSGGHNGGDGEQHDDDAMAAAAAAAAVQPSMTYASSIEAMAAHVEATHAKKRRSSPIKRTPTRRVGTRRAGSDGSNSSVGTGKLSASSRASNKSRGRRDTHPPPSTRWKILSLAMPVLLSFLACEAFLWLLVLRFGDTPILGAKGFHDEADAEKHSRDVIYEESEIIPVSDDSDSSIVRHIIPNDDDIDVFKGEPRDDIDSEPYGELTRLQTALDEGFDKLRHSDVELGDMSNRKKVESLCGDVWTVASEMLSSKYLNNSAESSLVELIGPGETRFDESQELEFHSLKSLTLDAQHCLGGAGMAFLSTDGLDHARLRVTTKVFDRLIEAEPYNPDARAGLGTSLLMQGIFYQEIRVGVDVNVQNSLLSLAAHHLKLASLLSTSFPSGADGSGSIARNAMSRLTKVNDENAPSSHAAILHNLALSYVALGDSANSIPILIRSAAISRENGVSPKPYWNIPNDVLRAAEERALLIAAAPKKKLAKKGKRRRIPFVSIPREDKVTEGR